MEVKNVESLYRIVNFSDGALREQFDQLDHLYCKYPPREDEDELLAMMIKIAFYLADFRTWDRIYRCGLPENKELQTTAREMMILCAENFWHWHEIIYSRPSKEQEAIAKIRMFEAATSFHDFHTTHYISGRTTVIGKLTLEEMERAGGTLKEWLSVYSFSVSCGLSLDSETITAAERWIQWLARSFDDWSETYMTVERESELADMALDMMDYLAHHFEDWYTVFIFNGGLATPPIKRSARVALREMRKSSVGTDELLEKILWVLKFEHDEAELCRMLLKKARRAKPSSSQWKEAYKGSLELYDFPPVIALRKTVAKEIGRPNLAIMIRPPRQTRLCDSCCSC